MSRNYLLFLEDIVHSCRKIQDYTEDLSKHKFFEDEKTVDAVLRNLEVIGEAVKNLPQRIRDRHTTINWRKIAGFRDIVAHEYFGIDEDIFWDITDNQVLDLLDKMESILQEEKDPELE